MSPRSDQKNAEIRQESMKKITDAAFALIAAKGFENTTIAEIARTAGVSKGLLYNYYTSKEDLLEKVILNAMAGAEGDIAGLMTDDPVATMENLWRYYFKELKSKPEQWRIMAQMTFRIDRFKFIHDIASNKIRAYLDLLESLLTGMGFEDPKGEAKVLAALFDGIAVQYLVIRENYPLDEVEDYLIKKYCKTQKS